MAKKPVEDKAIKPEDDKADDGFSDDVVATGALKLELIEEDGTVVETREIGNLIVTVGRNGIADQLLAAPTIGKPTHMAIGSGAVAEVVGDIALGSELGRVALTSKTRAGNVVTMVGDFPAGTGTGAVTEAGTFDAAAAGNMFQRVTFGVMNKSATATLKITWTLTIG